MCRLAIVIPCYKEEAVLPETTKRLSEVLASLVSDRLISSDSYLFFVDDGSTDRTWSIIASFHKTNKYIKGVSFSSNAGHQNALWAGLTLTCDNADIVVTIDADLQDDINAIKEMVLAYHNGYDIVYGVRKERNTDSWFKKYTALSFYRLMSALGTNTVYNHADFRLMSNRALTALLQYKERNLFIRGLVPLVGYKTTNIYYNRSERIAGKTKYSLRKMLNFALDGITSFSVKPLRAILLMGFIFVIISLIVFVYVLFSYFRGNIVPGWPSLMLSLWFCSGCLLMALGVVGEYVGKIYTEAKGRPRYNIENILMD